jgi:hypothetical protein
VVDIPWSLAAPTFNEKAKNHYQSVLPKKQRNRQYYNKEFLQDFWLDGEHQQV